MLGVYVFVGDWKVPRKWLMMVVVVQIVFP
jgi:hypothetical protein